MDASGSPVLTIDSITTKDSKSVEVTYEVPSSGLKGPVQLDVFRSATADGGVSDGSKLVTTFLGGSQLSGKTKSHTVNIVVPGGLPIDTAHPFVSVRDASDASVAPESFRIYVVGAVTAGYEPTGNDPSWVGQVANAMTADHYDAAEGFSWASRSNQPDPDATTSAADNLTNLLRVDIKNLGMSKGDVVDLHLVGFDRGAVVVGQALAALHGSGKTAISGGWDRLTLLDPVAANSASVAQTVPAGPLGPLGRLANTARDTFAAQTNDPSIVIPSFTDQSEVYYQRNTSAHSRAFADRIENTLPTLGSLVIQGASPTYYDASGLTHGHASLPELYAKLIAPTLGQAQGEAYFGKVLKHAPSVTQHSADESSAAATRADRKLIRKAVTNPILANAIFREIQAIDRNLQDPDAPAKGRQAKGQTKGELAAGQLTSLIPLVQKNSGFIAKAPRLTLATIFQQDLASLTGTAPGPVSGTPVQGNTGASPEVDPTPTGTSIAVADPNSVVASSLPASASLQADFSGVYDQGPLNSCTSNAVAGAIQYLVKTSTNPTIEALAAAGYDPSRLFLYYGGRLADDPSGQFSPAKGDGTYISANLAVAMTQGVPTEGPGISGYGDTSWPYVDSAYKKNPGPANALAAAQVVVTHATNLMGTDGQTGDQTVALMKQAVAGGLPVVFSTPVHASIDDPGAIYITNKGDASGTHSMLVVGYDDAYTVPGFAAGAFLVRNSWGTSYGINGYYYMPYTVMAKDVFSAYTVDSLTATTEPAATDGTLGTPGVSAPVNTGTGEVAIDADPAALAGDVVTVNLRAGAITSKGTQWVTPLIFSYSPATSTYTVTGIGKSFPMTSTIAQEYPYQALAGSSTLTTAATSGDGSYSVIGTFDGLVSNYNTGPILTSTPNTGSVAITQTTVGASNWLVTGPTTGVQLGETFAVDTSQVPSATPLGNANGYYSLQVILATA